MKIRTNVHTPVGFFQSKESEIPSDKYAELCNRLSNLKMGKMDIEPNTGKVFLSDEIVQDSVIEIEVISET